MRTITILRTMDYHSNKTEWTLEPEWMRSNKMLQDQMSAISKSWISSSYDATLAVRIVRFSSRIEEEYLPILDGKNRHLL
ncbi:hypothetical protein CEXT_779171 [Caerostris extrusa]|uniref:Uncharacterized protein n=1 Tax=Caerostris extrusa TaxID=172846 RepID=A0AAV4MZN2_CAEEX|nr:hypothetical protein CEXT_779171 [Caerostris extrusa]